MEEDSLDIFIGGDASEAVAALQENVAALEGAGEAWKEFATSVDAAGTRCLYTWEHLAAGVARMAVQIDARLNETASRMLGKYAEITRQAEAALSPQIRTAQTLADAESALQGRQLAAYEKYLSERDRLDQTYAARAAARRKDLELQAAQVQNPIHPGAIVSGGEVDDAQMGLYDAALVRAMSERAALLERAQREEEAILKEGAAQGLVTEARYYEELAGLEKDYTATSLRLAKERTDAQNAALIRQDRDEAWLAADAAKAQRDAEAARQSHLSLGSPHLWGRVSGALLAGAAGAAAPVALAGMAGNDVDSQWMAAVNNTTLSMKDALALRQNVLALMKEGTNVAPDKLFAAGMRAANFRQDGQSIADTLSIMRVGVQAATAQFADAEKTTEMLARELFVFKIPTQDAARVMNLLVAAAQETNQTLGQFQGNFGRVAQDASALHVSLEDAAAAYALLTKDGDTSAQSATAVRDILKSLVEPTKAVRSEIAALSKQGYGDLSVYFGAQNRNAEGLSRSLFGISAALHGNRDALIKLFPDMRASTKALYLMTDGSKDLHTLLGHLSTAYQDNDTYQKNYAQVTQLAGFQVASLENKVIALGTSFSKDVIPPLKDVIHLIDGLIGWFENLSAGQKRATVDALAFGAAGLAAASGLAKLIETVTLITTAGAKVAGLFTAWKAGVQAAGAAAAESGTAMTEMGSAASAVAGEGAVAFGPAGLLALALSGTVLLVMRAVHAFQQMRDAQDQAAQSAASYAAMQQRVSSQGERGADEVELQKVNQTLAGRREALQTYLSQYQAEPAGSEEQQALTPQIAQARKDIADNMTSAAKLTARIHELNAMGASAGRDAVTGAVNSPLVEAMAKHIGESTGTQCGAAVTAAMRASGFTGTASALARAAAHNASLQVHPNGAGQLPEGAVVFFPGKSGLRNIGGDPTEHFGVIGAGQHVIESTTAGGHGRHYRGDRTWQQIAAEHGGRYLAFMPNGQPYVGDATGATGNPLLQAGGVGSSQLAAWGAGGNGKGKAGAHDAALPAAPVWDAALPEQVQQRLTGFETAMAAVDALEAKSLAGAGTDRAAQLAAQLAANRRRAGIENGYSADITNKDLPGAAKDRTAAIDAYSAAYARAGTAHDAYAAAARKHNRLVDKGDVDAAKEMAGLLSRLHNQWIAQAHVLTLAHEAAMKADSTFNHWQKTLSGVQDAQAKTAQSTMHLLTAQQKLADQAAAAGDRKAADTYKSSKDWRGYEAYLTRQLALLDANSERALKLKAILESLQDSSRYSRGLMSDARRLNGEGDFAQQRDGLNGWLNDQLVQRGGETDPNGNAAPGLVNAIKTGNLGVLQKSKASYQDLLAIMADYNARASKINRDEKDKTAKDADAAMAKDYEDQTISFAAYKAYLTARLAATVAEDGAESREAADAQARLYDLEEKGLQKRLDALKAAYEKGRITLQQYETGLYVISGDAAGHSTILSGVDADLTAIQAKTEKTAHSIADVFGQSWTQVVNHQKSAMQMMHDAFRKWLLQMGENLVKSSFYQIILWGEGKISGHSVMPGMAGASPASQQQDKTAQKNAQTAQVNSAAASLMHKAVQTHQGAVDTFQKAIAVFEATIGKLGGSGGGAAGSAGSIGSILGSGGGAFGKIISGAMPWVGAALGVVGLLGGLSGTQNRGFSTQWGASSYSDLLGQNLSGSVDSGYKGTSGLRALMGNTTQAAAFQPTVNVTVAAGAVHASGVTDPATLAAQIVPHITQKVSDAVTNQAMWQNLTMGT